MSALAASNPAAPPLLEVRALHAGYGASEVLHGVDLQVGAGEVDLVRDGGEVRGHVSVYEPGPSGWEALE